MARSSSTSSSSRIRHWMRVKMQKVIIRGLCVGTVWRSCVHDFSITGFWVILNVDASCRWYATSVSPWAFPTSQCTYSLSFNRCATDAVFDTSAVLSYHRFRIHLTSSSASTSTSAGSLQVRCQILRECLEKLPIWTKMIFAVCSETILTIPVLLSGLRSMMREPT